MSVEIKQVAPRDLAVLPGNTELEKKAFQLTFLAVDSLELNFENAEAMALIKQEIIQRFIDIGLPRDLYTPLSMFESSCRLLMKANPDASALCRNFQ